jgi:hypothetical protein
MHASKKVAANSNHFLIQNGRINSHRSRDSGEDRVHRTGQRVLNGTPSAKLKGRGHLGFAPSGHLMAYQPAIAAWKAAVMALMPPVSACPIAP